MALVLLMGVPGSGKTTLCRKLKKLLGNMCVTFSFDDIFNDDGFLEHLWGKEYANISMLQLYGPNGEGSARRERKRCENVVREFIKSRAKVGDCMPLIVVDDIFYLRSMRRPFKRMANFFHLPYLVVVVDVPVDVCLIRNAGRPEKCRIPEPVIQKIHQQMELPEDFFCYKSTDDLKQLVEYIKEISSRKKPLTVDNNSERIQMGKSEEALGKEKWKKLELDLRKCVSELIREKDASKQGKLLANLKKNLYLEMREEESIDWDMQQLKDILWQRLQVQVVKFIKLLWPASSTAIFIDGLTDSLESILTLPS